MTSAPAKHLTAPVAMAIVVTLGDLAVAAIAWSAYSARRGTTVPGTSSWAAIYLFGLEATAGALILLLAIIAAGRSPGLATTAAWLAWLRLGALGITALLMILHVGFAGPFDASDVFVMILALADALAGVLISSAIARRTRPR